MPTHSTAAHATGLGFLQGAEGPRGRVQSRLAVPGLTSVLPRAKAAGPDPPRALRLPPAALPHPSALWGEAPTALRSPPLASLRLTEWGAVSTPGPLAQSSGAHFSQILLQRTRRTPRRPGLGPPPQPRPGQACGRPAPRGWEGPGAEATLVRPPGTARTATGTRGQRAHAPSGRVTQLASVPWSPLEVGVPARPGPGGRWSHDSRRRPSRLGRRRTRGGLGRWT